LARVTFFFDAAGRIARAIPGYEYFTIAGVAIRTADVDAVRNAIPAETPKWADATEAAATTVIDLGMSWSIAVVVVQIRKVQKEWDAFWDEAGAYHQAVSSKTRGKVGYATKAAPLIRYAGYADASGRIGGISGRCRHNLRSRTHRHFSLYRPIRAGC
jgi:hypothetical protein